MSCIGAFTLLEPQHLKAAAAIPTDAITKDKNRVMTRARRSGNEVRGQGRPSVRPSVRAIAEDSSCFALRWR